MRPSRAVGCTLLIAAVAVGSCRRDLMVPLGRPFEIAAGDVVRVAGTDLRLYFDRVVSDSRCPQGVNCITAGEAVVAIDASTLSREHATLELHVPGGAGSQAGAAVAYAGYRISIDALEPAPLVSIRPDPSAYTATLRVER